jgi:predicted ATPase
LFIERAFLSPKKMQGDMETFPYTLPCVKNLDLRFRRPITLLTGENGSGKSTLIEAIAVAYGMNAEGGSKNYNFSTVATHSSLSENIILAKDGIPSYGFFLRAETFYNTISYEASTYDEYNSFSLDNLGSKYAKAHMHCISHGESFYEQILKFRGNSIYLMDEPEAALSPSRQLSVLAIIRKLVDEGSQFIISTHSPILLAIPDAEIWQLGDEGIHSVLYEETKVYQMYRYFMENKDEALRLLLGDKYKKSGGPIRSARSISDVFDDVDYILSEIENNKNSLCHDNQKV